MTQNSRTAECRRTSAQPNIMLSASKERAHVQPCVLAGCENVLLAKKDVPIEENVRTIALQNLPRRHCRAQLTLTCQTYREPFWHGK
eukprot:129461-Amphidinium_carterae.1